MAEKDDLAHLLVSLATHVERDPGLCVIVLRHCPVFLPKIVIHSSTTYEKVNCKKSNI